VTIAGAARAAILAFAMAGCCGGSSDSSSSSTGSSSSSVIDPTAGGADIAAEVASKGTAATVRDRLKGTGCDATGWFKTPYVDQVDTVRPYAADKILDGVWGDPGIEGIDSSKNDKILPSTADDYHWYGALNALCKDNTQCQGDVCELTEPDIYAKTRIETRMINGQPKIVAVFHGVSMGGANTPLLETAYAAFVTAVTAQLPPGAAPAAPPAAPATPPAAPPAPGAPPAPPAPPATP
jgi:hypothetical protein